MKETDKQVDSGQCHIFCVENSVKLYKQNNNSVIHQEIFVNFFVYRLGKHADKSASKTVTKEQTVDSYVQDVTLESHAGEELH